ncbi:anaphase-promoting complex subunit 1-like [Leptidea sinapis]|uniref:anaphase-promoting complex subunit 1-like n=1 Tax=Leptidea sinapis TaxID=189913 RepID=UPI0021C2808D|nr:anaphase-promoting complex subunit 1-like [Leptidea sinapis]
MVMAGRGDVHVMRIVRRLRARVPTTQRPAVPPLTHGGQMAVHCALGLVFLGAGRATLSTTPTAVAAMIAAFFPKFPTHSEDNRYHLQAFRHLYVLAVEPRLILPRDIDSGKLCYANVQVVDLQGAVRELRAPCIIPELSTLREVRVDDPRYWPVCFQRDHNWEQLQAHLDYTWCVDIKQRAGCLSYLDDPQGYLTILAQTLTLDKTNVWSATADNIELFTNDAKVQNFVRHYLTKQMYIGANQYNGANCADCLVMKKRRGVKGEVARGACLCRKYTREEREHVQSLSVLTYECVVRDVLCALPAWTTFLKIIKKMKTEPTSYHMWQVKLLVAQAELVNARAALTMAVDDDTPADTLVSTEFTLAVKQKITLVFDKWETRILPYLRKYLGLPSSRKIHTSDDETKRILASYLVYHDLPRDVLREDTDEMGVVLCEGRGVGASSGAAVGKVIELLR